MSKNTSMDPEKKITIMSENTSRHWKIHKKITIMSENTSTDPEKYTKITILSENTSTDPEKNHHVRKHIHWPCKIPPKKSP
jgi:hypothetical protein